MAVRAGKELFAPVGLSPQPADLRLDPGHVHASAGAVHLLLTACRGLSGVVAASGVVLAPIAILFLPAQWTFLEGISFTGLRG